MMKKIFLTLVLATGILCLSHFNEVADAARKDKVTMAMAGEPSTFDPHLLTSPPVAMTHALVFDTLLFYDYQGKIIPNVAKSYRRAGPKIWEFKLHKGIKFTNGEPLDGNAVKFSIERILDRTLKSRQFNYFRPVKTVEVIGTHTVRIHMKSPDSFLIAALGQLGHIVPPKYYSSHDRKFLARNPVGSGPYKLAKWKKGSELVFKANPNYWNRSVRVVKTGVIKIIPEPTTRVAALVSGAVDMINSVSPQFLPMVKGNSNTEIVSGESPYTCYINLTIKKGTPWSDVRVRKAINYALDKELIIKNVLSNLAKIIPTNLSARSYGFNPNLKPFPYNIKKAKKLLAEAGYPNGFEAVMYVPRGRYLLGKETAEAIAGELAKIGLKIQVRSPTWGTFTKIAKSRWKPRGVPYWWYGCRMDAYMHAAGMYAGAIHSRSTWGGFHDKSVDKLIEGARAEPDAKKRELKYWEVARVLREEKVPLVFLWTIDQINAKKKSLKWKMRPNARMWLFDAAW
jgi:peptide/nickel transport system substrate-binding protein